MLHQIGNGASGPVFRAYDQDRDRLVAIKLFRLDLPPERVHQLVAEFEKLIAAELQHPVIAAPRATGIDNNSAYLALDFVAAESLDVVMRETGAAPAAQALRVAGQLAEALDYAADRHVVHGALHPRDILLSQEDIRVVGLGVARALEHVGVTAPVRRPYAPPERISDSGWDRSADVFSLAAIVFELLCGKRVSGTGSEAAEGLTNVSGDLEAVQRVFALALAADPAYRYTTASAFTDALKEAMGVEITTPKPKARRRPKLRVVAQDAPSDVALPLDEVPEVPGVPQVPEVLEEVPSPEPPAPSPVAEVRRPRRRKVPAPTPVAIETAATPLPEPILEPEPIIEPEPVSLIAPEPEPVIEPEPASDLPAEFAPVELPPEPEPPPAVLLFDPQPEPPVPSPGFFTAPEPDIREAAFTEPEISEPEIAEPEIAEPHIAEPHIAEPAITTSPIAESPNAGSPVWPIGVAAALGIALGFGAGYTIATRDRSVAPVATTTAAAPAGPGSVRLEPDARVFTEAPAASALVSPKPSVRQSAKADVAPAAPIAQPPVFAGRVLVRSTPSGARVFVDGKDRGQTPATIRELGQGEHRIRIVRDGYASAERRVTLSASRPSTSLSVPLAREAGKSVAPKPNEGQSAKAGTLMIESRPAGATVLIDGRPAGTTPMSLRDVRAGNHAVRIERDGYRTWTASVNIAAGEQNRVTASLEK